MPTGTGIVADTPVSIVIGAGVMLRDKAYVGPTVDNNLFAVDRTLTTPELNGIMWDLMGTDYINRSVARIESTVPSINATIIGSALPGVSVDTATPGMSVISDSGTRRLPDADYHDYELDLERPNGGQIQFEVDNAINTGSFEGELQDDGLFAPRLILTGRGTAAAPATAPWRIRLLDVAS
jgi:hypothetical protein